MEPTVGQATEPTYQVDKPSSVDNLKNNIVELIEFIAIVFAILMIIRVFVAEPHKVSGSSMIPNFHDGDYIITNKLAGRVSTPVRGEVLILHDPLDKNKVFIKRVIGLPTETIKISSGKVYINDQRLEEPYLPQGTVTREQNFLRNEVEKTIPEGNYFVMGDNRGNSSDSRDWGFLEKDLIIGQAFLRYWPLDKMMLITIAAKSN